MIARDKPRLPFSLNFSTFPLLPLALWGQPGQLSRVHISSWKGFFGCVCASCAQSLARHPSSSRSPCYPCAHGTCQEPGTAQPVLLVAMPHVHTVLQPQQMVTNQPRPPLCATPVGHTGRRDRSCHPNTQSPSALCSTSRCCNSISFTQKSL